MRIGDSPHIRKVIDLILQETEKGEHRPYPDDHLRRTALVVEEAGEALKEALNLTRRPPDPTAHLFYLRQELIQTAAMAIRQLAAMEEDA